MAKRANGDGSIRHRSDGRYEASLTVEILEDGRQVRKSFYGQTKSEVKEKLETARAGLKKGIKPVDGRTTLGDYLDSWLSDTVKISNRERTYESYRYLVNTHIKPALGKEKLAKLTPDHVQSWLTDKRASGLSANSVNRMRAVLRRALTIAERRGAVSRNVAKLTEPPRGTAKELQILSVEEAGKLLAAVRGHRLEALYTVALAIGLRQGEAIGLQWGDVNFAEKAIRVERQLQRIKGDREKSVLVFSEPKSAKGRRSIPLPAFALKALEQHRTQQEFLVRKLEGRPLRDDDLVFTNSIGKPLEPRLVHSQFKELLKEAEVRSVRFHDLRHTCASLLLAQGAFPKDVQEILGHSNIHMTMNVYAHAIEESKRNAADMMNTLLTAKPVQSASGT